MNSHPPKVPPDKLPALLKLVTAELDADVMVLVGPITTGVWHEYFTLLSNRANRRSQLLLVIDTPGGSPHSAYRIARLAQQYYPEGFVLYVQNHCKSAGTLVAIGADEIVMADSAELGPLDIQLRKPDELEERVSGLTPIHAIATLKEQSFDCFLESFLRLRDASGQQISTRMSAEIAAKMAIGLFRSVYAQIDPMKLGEYQRAMDIGKHYGDRLAGENLLPGAIDKLLSKYPAHEFVIDREEAGELFRSIREPGENEHRLALYLLQESFRRYRRQLDTDPLDSRAVVFFADDYLTEENENGGQNHHPDDEPPAEGGDPAEQPDGTHQPSDPSPDVGDHPQGS